MIYSFGGGSDENATEDVTGQNPDAILYDPSSKRVFTFSVRTGDSTAIDAKTGELAGTVALGGRPETGQADGAGHIYVNIEDKGQIVELDSKALKVLNTGSIAPCEKPSGLAFDVAHQRLFAGCGNQMMAVVESCKLKTLTECQGGWPSIYFDSSPRWRLL